VKFYDSPCGAVSWQLCPLCQSWKKIGWGQYEGKDRASGAVAWKASEVDMVFGSNAELRALAEYYAQSNEDFIKDFVNAWTKVMDADKVA